MVRESEREIKPKKPQRADGLVRAMVSFQTSSSHVFQKHAIKQKKIERQRMWPSSGDGGELNEDGRTWGDKEG